MSKRENSSLILQNLRKRDLRPPGDPILPLDEAERRLGGAGTASVAVAVTDPGQFSGSSAHDSRHDGTPASYHDSTQYTLATRLKPRERVARSALIVRLDPVLHKELESVARFNRLTMNDIAIEAIELHLKNFPHPADADPEDAGKS